MVFGCGGSRDPAKRPLMGRGRGDGWPTSWSSPRTTPATRTRRRIIDEIATGIDTSDERRAEVLFEPDRRRAIELAIGRAEPGDVVLLAGKGHETHPGAARPQRSSSTTGLVAREALVVLSMMEAGGVALLGVDPATPLLIRFLQRAQIGQHIREDGPATHLAKAGHPDHGRGGASSAR